MKTDFMVGPFEVRPNGDSTFNIHFGQKILARRLYSSEKTRQAVIDDLADSLGDLKSRIKSQTALYRVELVTQNGAVLDSFLSEDIALPGMTGAIPDDRYSMWAKIGRQAMPVTAREWAELTMRHKALENGWIANLLPDSIMTLDAEAWRAPTAFELRHVVGEGSFTGISGAKAADLLGMSAQNFRKYTAADEAASRQSISFAAWHLLLIRLQVTRPVDYIRKA